MLDIRTLSTGKNGIRMTKAESVFLELLQIALGNQIGRAAILDDGNYHYVLSCMAPEALGGDLRETWDRVFASFQVA